MGECKRDITIDRFRGLAIFSIMLIQTLADFPQLGFWPKLGSHKSGMGIQIVEGLQFSDIFAPMFLFAIALTYKKSFNTRKVILGEKEAKKHFIIRYIYLIAIGGVLRGCESFIYFINYGYVEKKIDCFFFLGIGVLVIVLLLKPLVFKLKTKQLSKIYSITLLCTMFFIASLCILSTARDFFIQIIYGKQDEFRPWGYWEALQAVGAAGLVTLLFINLSTIKRFLITNILFIVYIIFHQFGNISDIISVYAQQGGFGGIWGQSCLLLYGTVLSDVYHKNSENLTKYIFVLLGFGIASIVSMQYILPTMRNVSPSYILINIFIGGSVFIVLWLCRFINLKIDYLAILGKNSLAMYILQYLIIYGAKELIGYDVLTYASKFGSILFTFFMCFIMFMIAFFLDKRGIVIKL